MQYRAAVVLTALLVPSGIAAGNEVLVESPSDNRTYVIDLSSEKVQGWLEPVQVTAASFPAWLAPYQGATPVKVDVSGDRRRAEYRVGGSVQQLVQYYDELLRSQGYETKPKISGSGAGSVWASDRGETISVGVSTFRGATRLSIRMAQGGAKRTAGRRRLKEQWYDDSRGLLLVYDLDTGEQFHLPKRGFSTFAAESWPLSQAPGFPDEFPSWLPIYPGARVSRAVGPPDKLSPGTRPYLRGQFKTNASLEKVLEFYESRLRSAGVELTRRSTRTDKKAGVMYSGDLNGHDNRGGHVSVSLSRFMAETTITLRYTPAGNARQ